MQLPVCLFLLVVAGAYGADNANVTSVRVKVYYESLCPDSQKFIKEQLYPLWEKIMDNIDLTLIPYGKSTVKRVNETVMFECHHGEEECVGNKVQSCILSGGMVPMKGNQVKLINCLMTEAKKGSPYPTKSCVQKVGLSDSLADDLDKCANSTAGDEYYIKMGNMTDALEGGLTNVPTVTINDERNKAAVSDLMSAVCDKIAMNKPGICSSKKNGAESLVAMCVLPLAAIMSVRVL